jgi:hypothetical protein
VSAQGTVTHERALVELAQWIGRTLQYSASHPVCVQLGQKTHTTVLAALDAASPIEVGVLSNDVLVGGVSTKHPAIRARLGACLHERGALVLRLLHGVTLPELTSLVEILTLPAQAVFDRGGLLRLAMDAQLARVQFDELAHDVTAEEREAQRRRSRLRSFFREMLMALLGRRDFDPRLAEHVIELLEHPDIAAMILEEDPLGVTDATAGLALVAKQEEERSGVPLAAKVRDVVLLLSPPSRCRLLLGFPPLVEDLRAALAWCFETFSEQHLARFSHAAVREHTADLDAVLYALAVGFPHRGTRLSALRWLALSFFDVPADDTAAADAMRSLAARTADYDSFREEREILRDLARQAIVARSALVPPGWQPDAAEAGGSERAPFTGRRAVREVIGIATRTRSFDRFCESLPAAAEAMVQHGASDAVIGMLRGLEAVRAPPWQEPAALALNSVSAASAEAVLAHLDAAAATAEGAQIDEVATIVRLLAAPAPAMLLDRLDVSENRKMRRMVLDALPLAGPSLVPLLRSRLSSDQWFVVRNAVLLLGRIGAPPAEVDPARAHPDARVRLEVVRALRTMSATPASMDLVVGYLADPSVEVRELAYPLLRGELLGDHAIVSLQGVAADDQQTTELRLRVVAALERSDSDGAALALFALLHPRGLIESGSTGDVRDAAAGALRRSRAPSAAEYFERGLASSVRRVRKACERAAGVAS